MVSVRRSLPFRRQQAELDLHFLPVAYDELIDIVRGKGAFKTRRPNGWASHLLIFVDSRSGLYNTGPHKHRQPEPADAT
jgi:hypothetical protein